MEKIRLEDSPIVYNVSRCEGGDWVLFLHAAFVHHGMFAQQIEYFADSYNIIAVDMLGHGDSTDAKRADSIDKMSFWIKRIMERENAQKIHVVGVSLGAVIAQDFANKYPDNVSSLACFGGYDINNFDMEMQKSNSSSQMGMMLKGMISVKWFAKANKKISAYTERAQEEFYKMNLSFEKKSFMYLASLGSMVNKHKTGERGYPLLIGCGEHDIPMELEAVRMWAESEKNCRTVVFEGAGHCVNMDVPDRFNKVMEEFWK
ncbi:MAG: alpha/beta hydrolase [Ruminococcaceae bacterium]|nr:alpha/beta hydrolase [Oscillospiraceae bacterium]